MKRLTQAERTLGERLALSNKLDDCYFLFFTAGLLTAVTGAVMMSIILLVLGAILLAVGFAFLPISERVWHPPRPKHQKR